MIISYRLPCFFACHDKQEYCAAHKDHTVQVNFTDADVAATDGVYTVKVSNKSGFKLPITGGEGVVLFSVIGIVFMGGAAFLFAAASKPKRKKNQKV